jgi:hypothetical protein
MINDDLAKMVDVCCWKKIFQFKSYQFIISIHIPIILRCLFRWHWMGPNIFSPIHIIFELVMGPTCSCL